MNRAQRRAMIARNGVDRDEVRRQRRAERVAQKLEAKVLKMGAPEARRLLAEWAARQDHDRADADLLNKVAGHGA